MNRRNFLLAGSASAAVLAVRRDVSARAIDAAPGKSALHVGFAPPAGGALVAASRFGGGERIAGIIEGALALRCIDEAACGAGIAVEVAIGDGPRFQAVCAQRCGELLQVSAARQFAAAGPFAVHVNGEAIRLGAGALPIRRGSYVVLLGGPEPRWAELRLEKGVLRGAERPHMLLGLERAGLLEA